MKIVGHLIKFLVPFLLALGILWWMYRDTDWRVMWYGLTHELYWGWMLLSLFFGIVPLWFRAQRWRLALRQLDECPSSRLCRNAIFISYAASLVIPRIGEVTRCGTLKKYAQVSFSKSLGTVVAERVVDAGLMLALALVSLLLELPKFLQFLATTGTTPSQIFTRFTSTGYLVTLLCIVLALIFVVWIMHRVEMFRRGLSKVNNFIEGIRSLRHINQLPLYLLYSLGIWAGYFLHFYITFFCFDFTAEVPPTAGLLIFCAGTFAVLVPTPNGAGPWHFAVKTMLVIYGVAESPAILFAFLVHSIQTLLVVLLGVWGWFDLIIFRTSETSKTL